MVLCDGPVRDMGHDQLTRVLRPKVDGSPNLDAVLGDTPLDFFLFLSSMINVVANLGQANYSAANAFMSGLAAQRRRRAARPTSASWPAPAMSRARWPTRARRTC